MKTGDENELRLSGCTNREDVAKLQVELIKNACSNLSNLCVFPENRQRRRCGSHDTEVPVQIGLLWLMALTALVELPVAPYLPYRSPAATLLGATQLEKKITDYRKEGKKRGGMRRWRKEGRYEGF